MANLLCTARHSSAYNRDPFDAQLGAPDEWLAARKAKQRRVAAKVDALERKDAAAAAAAAATPVRSPTGGREKEIATESPEPTGGAESAEATSQLPRPERGVYKGGDARRWFT